MKVHCTSYILLLCLSVAFSFLSGCSSENGIDAAFDSFKEKLTAKDFEGLYLLLSEESKAYISEDEFLERYTNIFNGIQAEKLKISKVDHDEKEDTIHFSLEMETAAGKMKMTDYQLVLTKEENQWKIEWDESLIFPSMKNGDKVRITTINAKRGKILDRSGRALAEDREINTVGIAPETFDKSRREEKIQELAAILDINQDVITKKLEANTNPSHFVPLVDILPDNDMLPQIIGREEEGILVYPKQSRVYINEEAFGRLLGYIGEITAEELENQEGKGYDSSSFIGKAGLEQVYEEVLRGQSGVDIYIERDGKKISSLARKEPQNGQDIQLTIDADLQKRIYDEMKGDTGAAAAVHPKTGEVLALVSAPSYNANRYTTYITKTEQQQREESGYADEENRFTKLYSPGSVFKLLTAAIGLENGTIDPDVKIAINGRSWQKDSSWGNYSITRVNHQAAVHLMDAIQFSDNIYFAMSALQLESDRFLDGAKKFGIGEELNTGYPFPNGQLANAETIDNDILLADSGYGQGEIMVTPLHMALAYSALTNEGNIMAPFLVISDKQEAKIWKEAAISPEHLSVLQQAFTAVIEGDGGTASAAKISGVSLAGKTGTAEIKASQTDESGSENGWIVVTDLDSASLSLAIVLEDVKDKGGSKAAVPLAKNILSDYLNQ
ncbi:penicillin-binding protein [Evansella caseinilytica]|uniref:serine-type D-Ala-D-Ala carboxypeptidase n=1 Tax=Evansella caseinilytica TaxID=1503961 RepID=A0A1H3SNE6_9BACI|nr:penicillin-binding transpeptidase domain-containing protein [Evansella caseinilytica]SDZ39071.1 penicillin-binding protein [Evansella caseinilytica]